MVSRLKLIRFLALGLLLGIAMLPAPAKAIPECMDCDDAGAICVTQTYCEAHGEESCTSPLISPECTECPYKFVCSGSQCSGASAGQYRLDCEVEIQN